MTKEILKYMVVHPAAIVLLPRSFLLNVGYEVKGTLENCTKSKILKFSISNTFPPDGPSERMCQLRCFPSFQPFITSTYICKFIDSSKLQTCCSSEIHSLPFGLDYFNVLWNTGQFWKQSKVLMVILILWHLFPRKLCGNCIFVWQSTWTKHVL